MYIIASKICYLFLLNLNSFRDFGVDVDYKQKLFGFYLAVFVAPHNALQGARRQKLLSAIKGPVLQRFKLRMHVTFC